MPLKQKAGNEFSRYPISGLLRNRISTKLIMIVIRFLRTGKKNQAFFRVVATDKRNSTKAGRFLEILGFYNPLTKEKNLKADRIKYWISKGAQTSDTVHNLLIREGVIEGKKIPKHRPSKKKEEDKPEESPKAETKEEKKEEEKPNEPAEEAKPEEPKEDVKPEEPAKEEKPEAEAKEDAKEKMPAEEAKPEDAKEEEKPEEAKEEAKAEDVKKEEKEN
jgi:ribosomal protein S16